MGKSISSAKTARVHGRRPIRSSLAGPILTNPASRVAIFKQWAVPVIQFLTKNFPDKLEGVNVGFSTVPMPGEHKWNLEKSKYYSIDHGNKTIVLHRMPIQRFKGLHVDDEDHRRMFVEHIIYVAVCDYLGVEPWALLPGYFEHY